jgi:acyl carrier protein
MDRKEFFSVLEEITETNPGVIKGEDRLEEMQGWTSLAAIEFIAMADERFDLKIEARQLEKCSTVDDLVALLNGKVV